MSVDPNQFANSEYRNTCKSTNQLDNLKCIKTNSKNICEVCNEKYYEQIGEENANDQSCIITIIGIGDYSLCDEKLISGKYKDKTLTEVITTLEQSGAVSDNIRKSIQEMKKLCGNRRGYRCQEILFDKLKMKCDPANSRTSVDELNTNECKLVMTRQCIDNTCGKGRDFRDCFNDSNKQTEIYKCYQRLKNRQDNRKVDLSDMCGRIVNTRNERVNACGKESYESPPTCYPFQTMTPSCPPCPPCKQESYSLIDVFVVLTLIVLTVLLARTYLSH